MEEIQVHTLKSILSLLVELKAYQVASTEVLLMLVSKSDGENTRAIEILEKLRKESVDRLFCRMYAELGVLDLAELGLQNDGSNPTTSL
jgi:hypothetical protein